MPNELNKRVDLTRLVVENVGKKTILQHSLANWTGSCARAERGSLRAGVRVAPGGPAEGEAREILLFLLHRARYSCAYAGD